MNLVLIAAAVAVVYMMSGGAGAGSRREGARGGGGVHLVKGTPLPGKRPGGFPGTRTGGGIIAAGMNRLEAAIKAEVGKAGAASSLPPPVKPSDPTLAPIDIPSAPEVF